MPAVISVVGNTSPQPLIAAYERCLVSLVSTNDLLNIKEWSVWFDGLLSSAQPIKVVFSRCTTLGNLTTGTAFSQVLRHGSTGAALRAIGRVVATTSSEPGSSGILARRYVHPQVGYHEKFAYGDEPQVQNGQAVGIFVTSPTTLSALAEIVYEE